MTVPGMLHGAIRFADHPRALVRRIDTSRAAAHPGVVAVVTWRDVPGERVQGLLTRDWPLFVAEGETTRYVGDVLAAVAATTRHAAREAAALIEVDYDVLEPVTDPAAALADGAPAIHAGGNLLASCVIRRGDVDAALAGAAHVATETFETQRIEHAFLEPEAALAVPADGRRLGAAAARLLAGPGRLGGPPPDRLDPRAARGGRPRHPGRDGRRVRRQGGPRRPGSRGAAGPRDRPARSWSRCRAARASASTRSATR